MNKVNKTLKQKIENELKKKFTSQMGRMTVKDPNTPGLNLMKALTIKTKKPDLSRDEDGLNMDTEMSPDYNPEIMIENQ